MGDKGHALGAVTHGGPTACRIHLRNTAQGCQIPSFQEKPEISNFHVKVSAFENAMPA